MTILEKDFDHTLNGLSTQEKEKLNGATILITGCAGFLGYYYMNFFQAKAETLGLKRVIGLDNFMLGYPDWIDHLKKNPLFDVRKFDIIKDKIEDIDGAEQADFIIHMASIASPVFYRKYPIETLDANVWGLRSLLDFYKDKPIKGFLFYSSSELYGNPDAAIMFLLLRNIMVMYVRLGLVLAMMNRNVSVRRCACCLPSTITCLLM
jgi:UDP-glucuronate decarboxylase